MALISLKHVTKRYKGLQRPALDDVSVDIDRGDFVFLVGASGAGKSTFLSLLLREEIATSGEIHVAGHDLRRLPNRRVPAYRREIGFVFQDYKLLMNKTVRENVAFALEVIGTRRSQIGPQVDRALRDVGLESKADKRPSELSGGEMQRVSIARAYVNQPKIILADEPTGNLDPTTSVGIMRVLNAINLTGTTIVMATHNEEIVNSMSKRVLELNGGRLVRDEANGRYDSARYFPDAQAEREAALDGGTVHMGAVNASIQTQTPRDNVTVNANAAADSAATAVSDGISAGAGEDEGIAKLEQAIHSGNTGVYGKVFENVEDTLTWGKGLRLDEYAAQQKKQGSSAQSTHANDGADGKVLEDKVVENPQLPDPDAKFRPAHADYSEDDSRAVSDGAQDARVPADAAQADAAAGAPQSDAAQSDVAQSDAVQTDAVQSPQGDAAPAATQGVGADSPDDPAHVDTLAQLARGTVHKQSVPAQSAQVQSVPAQPVPVPPPAPPVPAPQQASGDKNANNTEGVN